MSELSQTIWCFMVLQAMLKEFKENRRLILEALMIDKQKFG